MTSLEDGIVEKNNDKEGLNPHELDIACFIEQVYLVSGGIPTDERILQEFRAREIVTEEWLKKLLKSARLKNYLDARGIEYATKAGNILTPIQLLTVRIILNPADRRSIREKLKSIPEAVGGPVTPGTYEKWMRNPAFKKVLSDMSFKQFGDFDHEALTALMNNVRDGLTPDIKLYMEMRGLYTPRQVHEINPMQLIAQVVEVVSKYLAPDQLMAVGQELEMLLPQNQLQKMTAIEGRVSEG